MMPACDTTQRTTGVATGGRLSRVSNPMKNVVAASLPVGIPATPLRAEPRADVATAAREAIKHLDLQTELPRDPAPQPKFNMSLPPELVLLALIIVAAMVIYAFRDQLGRLRFSRRGPQWRADRDGSSEDVPAAQVLETSIKADDLAAQGRFVEAMHLLLLQLLTALRRRLGVEFADSLTSREILRAAQLSDPNRMLLHDIVARVEWCHFGGYPAALADYVACRQSFDALLASVHAGNGG